MPDIETDGIPLQQVKEFMEQFFATASSPEAEQRILGWLTRTAGKAAWPPHFVLMSLSESCACDLCFEGKNGECRAGIMATLAKLVHKGKIKEGFIQNQYRQLIHVVWVEATTEGEESPH